VRVIPTAEIVRRWSDELLNDHLKNCSVSAGYMCAGCTKLNRDEFERVAVVNGDVDQRLVEGWL
jgi:hypothetical protein